MSQKRGGSFNHYDGRQKKHRFNTLQGSHHVPFGPADRNRNDHGGRPNPETFNDRKFKSRDNPVLEYLERLPDPTKCEPCKLAAAELQTGTIALLDKVAAEEQTPDGDRDVLHHARELRRLLAARAAKSAPSLAKRTLDERRPDKSTAITLPAYVAHMVEEAKELPTLPPITEPSLQEAVFTHISHHGNVAVRGFNSDKISYEHLEFLGDAYIELIASRLIYNRFPHVDVPEQAYFREQLVKNETLGRFSNAYGLPDRLKHGGHFDSHTKAWNKIVADVFEAYVAAIVLSDPENGFTTAEKWLTELWAPQLLTYRESILENPRAKDDIQRLVFHRGVKLDYREERNMVMENGVQKYFIGLYITGWGYEDEWLGSGEGRNKAHAALAAATDALHRNSNVLQTAAKKKQEMLQDARKLKELAKQRDEECDKGVIHAGEDAPEVKAKADSPASAQKDDQSKGLPWLEKEKRRKEKKEKKRKSAFTEGSY